MTTASASAPFGHDAFVRVRGHGGDRPLLAEWHLGSDVAV
jgi:hypothetical protein